MSLKELSNDELIESTKQALHTARKAEVTVIQHFREIEARKLWTDAGTLYQYLMKTFDLTDDQVYPRLQAMRLATELPEIENKLESGDLVMTNVLKAHQVLKSESKKRKISLDEKRLLLKALEKVSTRKADKILAEKYPASHRLAEKVKPVSPDRNLIQFYVDDVTLQSIDELKAKYSHQMPEGRMEDLMKILIKIATRTPRSRKNNAGQDVSISSECRTDAAVESFHGAINSSDFQSVCQNRGETEFPIAPTDTGERTVCSDERASGYEGMVEAVTNSMPKTSIHKSEFRSRHISADVRREMEKTRNQGCSHVVANGDRCGSTHFLQMDHIHEFHRGGSNELQNLRWMCGFHNRNRNPGIKHNSEQSSSHNAVPIQNRGETKCQNYPPWLDS